VRFKALPSANDTPIVGGMHITVLQNAFADFNARDAAFAERQSAATTDAQRFELERMRRFLLVKLEAIIQGESTRDFIRQVECEIAGEQRAA
jgi:hypothetical protein